MRAAEYLSVGFSLEAAILKGSGHALEVGISDIVLRHKIVNFMLITYPNRVS